MGRRWDATLATVGLAAVLAVVLSVGAPASVVDVAGGAVLALVAEGLTQLAPGTVRRYWERPAVQVGGLAAGATGVVAVAVLRPAGLWAVVGGLAAYLLVLAGVAVRSRIRSRSVADGGPDGS